MRNPLDLIAARLFREPIADWEHHHIGDGWDELRDNITQPREDGIFFRGNNRMSSESLGVRLTRDGLRLRTDANSKTIYVGQCLGGNRITKDEARILFDEIKAAHLDDHANDGQCCTCGCTMCNPNGGKRPDTKAERGGHDDYLRDEGFRG